MSKYEPLFQPLMIGRMEIKNRIIFSPMTTFLTDVDDTLSQASIAYFEARAKGGAGMLITEACFIDPNENANSMGLNFQSKRGTVQFARLADVAHRYGAKLCIQVSAGSGRTASPEQGQIPYSASAVPALSSPKIICRELTKEEIGQIIQKITESAMKAVIAGADAIEIHAHNGYLLDQFISPQWNIRTDEYGGELENRMRMPKELISSIRATVGPSIPIIFRISVDHKYPGGRTLEDTEEILKALEPVVDAFDVDFGAYESIDYMFPSYYMGSACSVDLAKAVRKMGIQKPIMNAGNHTPDSALEFVRNGTLDAVMFGRSMLADPELPNKLREDRDKEVKPCIRCNEFCLKGVLTRTGIRCAVNAEAGEEIYQKLEPATNKKKVLVIGGGPGGCEAAITAAMRGHEVVLCEANEALGGMLQVAATPDFKMQLKNLITWDEVMLKKYGVDVRLGERVDENSEILSKVDEIIVATGAKELVPPIPGIDSPGVIRIADAHRNQDKLKGENIVIAGGGLSGCDFAIELVDKGKKVTIIEMREKVAADVFPINAITLFRTLGQKQVTMMTGAKITSMESGKVIVQTTEGEKCVEADTIVLALGMRADKDLAEKLRIKFGTRVRKIGDCEKPGKVGNAVREGYYAGATV